MLYRGSLIFLKHVCILSLLSLWIMVGCAPKTVTPPPSEKPARISLVLGAGAARGFAHIGVLKVLETHRIPIDMVVGTSAGSLVGALYAYGYNAYQIQSFSLSLSRDDLFDLVLPDNGFIKGERLQNYVNRMLRNTPIESLRIPFYAIATDIQTGEETGFARGNTGMAVRASCSIPGIFQPVKISGRIYVDGGVVSPVAVEFAKKQGADVVIAVDISSGVNTDPPSGTIETILQAVDIMYSRIAENQLRQADVVIRPRVRHIASSDISKRHEAILEGEKAALEAIPKIVEILSKLKEEGKLPAGKAP
ncbi:MAG: patatin-like phospholipase family protein [Syntrophales bacterium]|nr:patatin-like phospholipase family protein [Syntrophales bacterium]